MIPFPNVEFKTIVVDPPWTPKLNAGFKRDKSKAYPDNYYPTLTLDEIINIKPPIASQAHLYIWCISQHVNWAYSLAEAWKAEPIILWTWKKPGLGVGRFRCNTEHILVTRVGNRIGNPFGNGGRYKQATNGTCFEWERGRHSEKPQGLYDLVSTLSPGPKLDMYARKEREGWYVWGNEINFKDSNEV